MSIILIIIIYAGLFYYLFVVRKKKEKAKMDELMASLRPGVRFCTISGIYGVVVEVRENDILADLSCESGKTIITRVHKGAVKRTA